MKQASLFGGADLSEDRNYRYRLWREWGSGPTCLFVMLNPSTADEGTDDHTIRKCTGFAMRFGAGRIFVVNLFAYRATYAEDLAKQGGVVGTDNDAILTAEASAAQIIVAAWGDGKPQIRGLIERRASAVKALLAPFNVYRLGELLPSGNPRHPLMLP